MTPRASLILPVLLLAAAPASRARAEDEAAPEYKSNVEVTATKIPEEVAKVPASVQVITGDELRAWGATNLQQALALVQGVDIAPGGDNGPRASVPEFWGLREFDAFLLVVDGRPWGGAFNPALATLDLHDVDRIEVLHGPAPVSYGATSFVGVIQVIHRGAAEGRTGGTVSGHFGSYESGGGNVTTALPEWLGFRSSLSVDASRRGYRDDRTDYRVGHARFQNARKTGPGELSFDVDGTWLDQDPASPHPRQGPVLSPLVPLDANHNPEGADLDENRIELSGGYTQPVGSAGLSITGSVSHSSEDALRGFLVDVSEDSPNAHGFESETDLTDIYLDAHLGWTRSKTLRGTVGVDFLHGEGEAEGGDFDYFVHLDGSGAPEAESLEPEGDLFIEDRRAFTGAYGLMEWIPTSRLRLELGARLNHTSETREAGAGEEHDQEAEHEGEDGGAHRSDTRMSGSAGAVVTAWEDGADALRFYGNARSTFKPAAVELNLADAGEEGEEGGGEESLLEPEKSLSGEIGLKTVLLEGRLEAEANVFRMDLENVVLPQVVNGLPDLVNGGKTRFEGFETGVHARLPHHVDLRGTYAYHNSRFRDFLTEFDGVPTQLEGKRFEMSPHHLAAFGLGYFPERGVFGVARVNVVGDRYLNKRNTALADSYGTLMLGAGYRAEKWEVRLDGHNLTDKRPPISESEVGDAQYYRLPARYVEVSTSFHF